MKTFLLRIFTWWNGQTLGTWFFTLRKGVRVGQDSAGNVYYTERKGQRRWVVYGGLVDATSIPVEWHGWLHHTVDEIPDSSGPSYPNLTGTAGAYRPRGSLLTPRDSSPIGGSYRAWTPPE